MEYTVLRQLRALLELMDVPAFFMKDGRILCLNEAAKGLMLCEGAADATLYELDPAPDHVLSLELCGRRHTLSCKRYSDGLLCQVSLQEQTPGVSADYLDIISGELRKPLGELMAALEKLYPSLPRSEQTAHDAAEAQKNVYRLLRLASQLNAGSRVKRGSWQLNLHETDFAAWLDQLARQAEDLFSYSHARFRYTGLTAPFTGCADLEKLERSIWNLLSNALLHAPKGSLVQMEACRSGTQLILCVQNESEEHKALHSGVFSHDTERTGLEPQNEGLGFGLAIVRACAELHGGSVLLSTQKQGGTTVVLRIPVEKTQDEAHSETLSFDYSGGVHHGLMELSDALNPEAFCPEEL